MFDVKELGKLSDCVKFKKDTKIIRETDETWDEMYIMLMGEATVVKNYGTPDRVELYTLGPGDFFGEMSLFCSMPRSATVIAKDDCIALPVTALNFFNFSSTNPEAVFQLLSGICARLNTANEKKVELEQETTEAINKYEEMLKKYVSPAILKAEFPGIKL